MEEIDKAVLKAIGYALIVFILVVGGCSAHQDYRKAQVLEAGVDPLTVTCTWH